MGIEIQYIIIFRHLMSSNNIKYIFYHVTEIYSDLSKQYRVYENHKIHKIHKIHKKAIKNHKICEFTIKNHKKLKNQTDFEKWSGFSGYSAKLC